MAKFNMQTLSKNAQLIGQDKLIQLKLLQPGIIVCTWKVNSCKVAIAFF